MGVISEGYEHRLRARNPIGLHNYSDGGVTPSENASYNNFCHFSRILKAP